MVFQMSLSMVSIECCRPGCGMTFAVPEHWVKSRREDHANFYCPNGHTLHYSAETEAERLRKQLAQMTSRCDQTQAALRDTSKQLDTVKKNQKRLKTRISKGVCPCCNRQFQNLRRHMETKHPDAAKT